MARHDRHEGADPSAARDVQASVPRPKLSKAGFHLYLANDTMCLMSGPSHDEHQQPRQDRILDTETIPGAGGGDW